MEQWQKVTGQYLNESQKKYVKGWLKSIHRYIDGLDKTIEVGFYSSQDVKNIEKLGNLASLIYSRTNVKGV